MSLWKYAQNVAQAIFIKINIKFEMWKKVAQNFGLLL
jgi:hypothetical protein